MKPFFVQLALLFFLFASSVAAQGIRFDSTVQQQGTIGTVTNAVILPVAPQIAFCNFPANAVPCTNKATTYTTNTLGTPCSTSTQIVLTNTTSCVASPDAQDNWGVWAAAGQYAYTITLPGGFNLGPYNVTMGIPSGTNLTLGSLTTTGPNTLGGGGSLAGTFSGNPTLSGNVAATGTLTGPQSASVPQVICSNVTPVTSSVNTTAKQALMSCTIPNGLLNQVGRNLNIWASVLYSTPANSTSSLELAAALCTVSGCGSGVEVFLGDLTSTALPTISISGQVMNLQMLSTTQTGGASAQFEAHGNMVLETPSINPNAQTDRNTGTIGPIDSTGALFLQIFGAFSNASASNVLSQRQLRVMVEN